MLLLGMSSYQFGMYQRAIDDWKRLQELVTPGSAMENMVKQRIDKAQQMLTGETVTEIPE